MVMVGESENSDPHCIMMDGGISKPMIVHQNLRGRCWIFYDKIYTIKSLKVCESA